jgi:uncharacterized protein YdhG (YjbR/CyaY superfamily)
MSSKPKAIDEYLAPLKGKKRAALTKSSLHFHPDEPLPATLVRKLLRARIAETQSRQ